ncbi:MAG: M81 family metallopeptidase, partial [Armatimonadetes bacterium]|nr:M81 family metallopeptidase [Armatimonadota bacterium]
MARHRIAVGGILTECNHFGGLPNDLAAFARSELRRGNEILEATGGVVGGLLSTLGAAGAEAAPLLYASACPGGPVTSACYQELREELLARLEAELPVHGVLLPLHGAATVEDVGDPEGDLIQAVRARVGPDVPIVATLDLHAHVTADMVLGADGLVAWETYPHRDAYQTGARGARLLLGTVLGSTRPTMAFARVPVITSAIRGCTEGEDPFADLMRLGKGFEKEPGVLSVSVFMVHPNLDLPDMGSGGLVITDGDPDRARELALQIADAYWSRRQDLEPRLFAPRDAIRAGLSCTGGPVVLVEAADCCGGGAAGDSVNTLEALLEVAPEAVS